MSPGSPIFEAHTFRAWEKTIDEVKRETGLSIRDFFALWRRLEKMTDGSWFYGNVVEFGRKLKND